MKCPVFGAAILAMAPLLNSCGHPPETDVTTVPKYNFSSFAGTVWKTKVKVAIADLNGRKYLLAPESFDSTHPKYDPPPDLHSFTVLPAGTQLRIDRLMKNNGKWSGVRVLADLVDRSHANTYYLDPYLLAKNKFIWPGWSSSNSWGADPDMLEK